MIIESGMFEWFNGRTSRESQSDIEIYRSDDKHLVIATERSDNPGPSVTNGAEYLWPSILKQFRLDPGKTVLIEHYKYPDRESWDVVTFSSLGSVTWSGIRKDKMHIIMKEFTS